MKTNSKLLLISTISLLVFIFIILNISYSGFLVNLDFSLNSAVKLIQNNFLTDLSRIIGIIFDTTSMIFIFLIFVVYLWLKNYKKESIFSVFIMLIDLAVVFVLKEIVQRARPLNSFISETGFSFPSGHATIAVVFFGFLIYLALKNKFEKIKLIISFSVFLILLISFSRIYLNLHYLSDILGGFVLGIFILTFCFILRRVLEKQK